MLQSRWTRKNQNFPPRNELSHELDIVTHSRLCQEGGGVPRGEPLAVLDPALYSGSTLPNPTRRSRYKEDAYLLCGLLWKRR